MTSVELAAGESPGGPPSAPAYQASGVMAMVAHVGGFPTLRDIGPSDDGTPPLFVVECLGVKCWQ